LKKQEEAPGFQKPMASSSSQNNTWTLTHSAQSLKRLFEIADQIFDVLDADRQSDQLRRDAGGAAQRLGDRAVAHGPGMADEALDAAERLGKREIAEALEHPDRLFMAALTKNDTMPPPLLICFAARLCCGWLRKPG